jgi:hypothetical protein
MRGAAPEEALAASTVDGLVDDRLTPGRQGLVKTWPTPARRPVGACSPTPPSRHVGVRHGVSTRRRMATAAFSTFLAAGDASMLQETRAGARALAALVTGVRLSGGGTHTARRRHAHGNGRGSVPST